MLYTTYNFKSNTWGISIFYIYRIIHPEMFGKKGVVKNGAKFTGKHVCRSLFFIIIGLRPLFKKRLRHRCFSVNLLRNSKEHLFIEHLRWLPLHLLTQNITDHKRFSRHEIYQYKYILCGMIFEYDF